MKTAIVISIIAAAAIGMAAGYFINENATQRQEDTRAQALEAELQDSIASYRAWIADTKAEQIRIATEAKQRWEAQFGNISHYDSYKEGMAKLEQARSAAESETLPDILKAKRHIALMERQISLLKRP